MPEQTHYTDDVLKYGYVYTNRARDMIQIVQDDMVYFTEMRATRKAEYEEINIESNYINRKHIRNQLGSRSHKALRIAAEKEG